jgi:hypothetical protein
MFVSVTRLRLGSWKYFPAFFWHVWRSRRQLVGAAAFLAGKTLVEAHRTFWTLTAWENEQAMRGYRSRAGRA